MVLLSQLGELVYDFIIILLGLLTYSLGIGFEYIKLILQVDDSTVLNINIILPLQLHPQLLHLSQQSRIGLPHPLHLLPHNTSILPSTTTHIIQQLPLL